SLDRRGVVRSEALGLILVCLGLILNSLSGSPRPWILFLIAAMFAALNGIHRPSIESMTPQLVNADHLAAVSALSTLRYGFNFIVGPGLAGILVASLGPAVAYSNDLPTFLGSVATLLAIRAVPGRGGGYHTSLRPVNESLL